MNITYTWKILSIKMAPSLDSLTDVVTSVSFEYTGTDSDSGFDGTFNGTIPIGKPDSSNFVPLKDLTENEVIDWVKSIYNLDHPNQVVEKIIVNKITPKNENVPMPWDPNPPTPPPGS